MRCSDCGETYDDALTRCPACLAAGPVVEPEALNLRPSEVPSTTLPPAEPPPPKPPVPDEVARQPLSAQYGKFVRVELLGKGGIGEVWKAWDVELGRWVALKFLRHQSEHVIARFRREAQIAGRLSHPNIAGIYEAGEANGEPFIAMQFVPGRTLENWPRTDRRLTVRLVRDAARAVAFAWRQGVVHRDLKPANLMISEGHLYVMDFGLARPAGDARPSAPAAAAHAGDARISVEGSVVGTPAYMPPEQARGEPVDARADVWALGATLFELLTGKLPFDDVSHEELMADRTAPPRRHDPTIEPDLQSIVMKCLRPAPAERYAHAGELADDLDRWLAGEPVRAHAGVGYRAGKGLARRKALLAMAAGLLAASVAGALYLRRATHDAAREKAQPHLDLARQKLRAMDAARRDPAITIEKLRAMGQAVRRELDRAIELCPTLAEAYLERARSRLLEFDNDAARPDLCRAIELAPTMPTARLERAILDVEECDALRHEGRAALGKTPDDERKAAELERTFRQDLDVVKAWSKDVPELALCEAMMLFGAKEFGRAAEVFESYLQGAEHDSRAWMWYAHTLIHLRGSAHAAPALDRAIAAGGALDPGVMFLRSYVHADTGELDKAIECLDRALAISNSRGSVTYNRGVEYARLAERGGPKRREYARKAVADFTETLRVNPHHQEAYRARARMRHQSGDLRGAREDIDEYVRLRPGGAAFVERARIRNAAGDHAGALADLDEAGRHQADTGLVRVVVHVAWGDALRAAGREEEAVEKYRAGLDAVELAVKANPANAEAREKRGNLRERLGDTAGALAEFEEALRLKRDAPACLVNRALMRERMGNLDGAVADAQRAVGLPGCPPDAYRQLASILTNRGRRRRASGNQDGARADFEAAVAAAQSLTQLEPDDLRAPLEAARALGELGRFDEALRLVGDVLVRDDAFAEGYRVQVIVLEQKKDMDGALAVIDQAIVRFPKDAHFRYLRGMIRFRRNESEPALQDFREAVTLNGQYVDAIYMVGFLALREGRRDEARSHFERAVAIDARYALGWARLADLAWEDRDAERADELYTRTLQLRAPDAETLVRRARVRAARANWDGVLDDASAAARLDPRHPFAHYWRGVAQSEKGEHAAAIEPLTRALELQPRLAHAFLHRARSHEALGNKAAAVADLEGGLVVAPQDSEVRAQLEAQLKRLRP